VRSYPGIVSWRRRRIADERVARTVASALRASYSEFASSQAEQRRKTGKRRAGQCGMDIYYSGSGSTIPGAA